MVEEGGGDRGWRLGMETGVEKGGGDRGWRQGVRKGDVDKVW